MVKKEALDKVAVPKAVLGLKMKVDVEIEAAR